jgi:hypothetical protein
MYRRNGTNGSWVLKASDGHGAYWTKAFALADDFEDADAKSVLTFYQAQDQAKKLARGGDGGTDGAPITVDSALRAYRRDLEAREANPYNGRVAAAAPHQRAAEQARGAPDERRTEDLARWPARQHGAVDDQSTLSLPVRRAGAGGAIRQAHSEPGCLGNRPRCFAECATSAKRCAV